MKRLKQGLTVGETQVTFEAGYMARQASGSVWIAAGDTRVLVTAQGAKEAKVGLDFLPLTVDYQEKMAAAGRIPGGFFKREGKPRDEETLTSRMIDRSVRPLFADGWACETQVIATVFSADPDHPADTLALTGASLALRLSDIPFSRPIAGLRVCRVEGALIINPGFALRARADVDMFVTCSRDAIIMVEGGGQQMSERDAIDALFFAHAAAQPLLDLQESMVAAVGRAKRRVVTPTVDVSLEERVRQVGRQKLKAALAVPEKHARAAALDAAKKATAESLVTSNAGLLERTADIAQAWNRVKSQEVRRDVLEHRRRIDGRGPADIRPIETELGLLPRAHGSALFTRGETQALVSVTLGTRQDEQKIDDLRGESYRSFMLHYNFPPYSVGETKFLRGPGRREVGHGALAERALAATLQRGEDFPYVVRVVSDITESNGSSSMATVCGGSMAMMAAGVPCARPCAGIAMGLIKEGDQIAILSDILGDEDHLGDMDFKVAGTQDGITAIQMDIKIEGISRDILTQALEQARVGRLHILACMGERIAATAVNVSAHAPRIQTMRIKPERIRDLIGPGGKVIKGIVAATGCQINVEDDGLVQVSSSDAASGLRAIKRIEELTREAEMGRCYLGTVKEIRHENYALVELFAGTLGLLHVTEVADKPLQTVGSVLQEGDEVLVKVIGMDRGKIRLSRREALADEKRQLAKDAAQVAPVPMAAAALP